ncbi:BTB/POZ domain-containing protein At3g49900 isoform X1 [Juglans microcarpa x Juglans regia]|uniref:BTB/POZ domain-containing protein At3g49900 isoform X1 n=1 Tax=Juglans microcarpa x Juglans regia TaxID=2249226 RepID=UPI001B7F4D81|nr:BTB/POZ domain-containing protein At3g49900 isoform X1 [Juglans microcarpa x Juglans regia]
MRAWKHLGIVKTIDEEKEYGFSASSSPSLSPTDLSSPPTPDLHTRVQAWSLARGQKTDILVRVHGRCFHLHKDALTTRSTYFNREITEISDFTLSPPLNITPETFSLVADFCYGSHIVLTPFNIAALRTAAELLEMADTNGDGEEENLMQITEEYFHRIINVNREYASIVFRSCLPLLPEAETTAYLVSRSVEALSSSVVEGGGGDGVNGACCDDVISMSPEDFLIVAKSMHRRLTSHDVLYRTVDLYFKGYSGKISDDLKAQICNSIDCNKLSSQLLLEAVQNPIMPLRFIVRAMLMEQLNTRRSILISSTAADHIQPRRQRIRSSSKDDGPTTLGAILQREAALRQAAHLKAAMDATSSRIQSLEKELNVMKKLLNEPDILQRSILMGSDRSSSFHYGSKNKIERGERGSASSASLRYCHVRSGEKAEGESSSWDKGSCNNIGSTMSPKNIRRRLINGLKSAFWISKSPSTNGIESRKSSMGRSMDRKGAGDHELDHG